MRKVVLLFICMFIFANVVSAAGVNGDFEGNPIVKVTSNGQEVMSEDVPAIIYKDRTMVPIYFLSKLGATVQWNKNSYAVDVNMNQNQKISNDPNAKLKDTYEWINDTNNQIWMYTMKFNVYLNQDNPESYVQTMDKTYQDLVMESSDLLNYVMQVKNETTVTNQLDEMVANQTKLLGQVGNTRNLFAAWTNNKSDAQLSKSLNSSILLLINQAEKNVSDVKKLKHDLIKQKSTDETPK